jgi:hypothetical protein
MGNLFSNNGWDLEPQVAKEFKSFREERLYNYLSQSNKTNQRLPQFTKSNYPNAYTLVLNSYNKKAAYIRYTSGSMYTNSLPFDDNIGDGCNLYLRVPKKYLAKIIEAIKKDIQEDGDWAKGIDEESQRAIEILESHDNKEQIDEDDENYHQD